MKFRSSESETLFVFTVITRSQNIGRPLLKRFPSCAIVCSYIIPLQHSPSQFAKHTGNIFFMSSQAFLCVRTNMCTHIQVYTYTYMEFHPYPFWSDDFFRGLPLARLYYLFCVLERGIAKAFTRPMKIRHGVVTIIKRPSHSSALIFNTLHAR